MKKHIYVKTRAFRTTASLDEELTALATEVNRHLEFGFDQDSRVGIREILSGLPRQDREGGLMSGVDKQALARVVTGAKPTDLAVAHAHAVGGTSGKEALDSLKNFVGKKADYTVIVVRG